MLGSQKEIKGKTKKYTTQIFPQTRNFKNTQGNEVTKFFKRAEFFLARMKGQRDEGDGRILLGDNAAAHQFPRSWESRFQLVSLQYKYCGSHVYSNATRAKSYLHHKFPKGNYWASRLVSVNNICIQTPISLFKHG